MWNLELGFTEDETIHDGFCTTTLLRLCAEESIKKSPNVKAIVENKTIALSIDKSVFILENEDITSNPKNITFDSTIDALSISTSGDIIICALNNGHIHGIFARGYPVFDLTIEDTKSKVIGIERDTENNFKLFYSNGNVYLLSNIDESQLYSSKIGGVIIEESVTFEEVLLENVKLSKLPNVYSLNEITSYCYLNLTDDLNQMQENFLFISGNNDFIKFQNEKFITKVFLPQEYNGIKSIYDLNSYIIALTKSGEIFEICPYTRTLFNCFTDHLDYKIKEIVIMESNNKTIELLMLCEIKENKKHSMKIVEFPSFKVINEIYLSNYTWLINQPKGAVNLYYLSCAKTNDQQLPLEIEIKIVKETQPEERMKKLIQKGHLEDAEEFGKQYNLSIQPVYKARVRKYLMEISSLNENNPEPLEKTFLKLIDYLKLVEDKKFFHEIRLIQIPSRKFLSMFLELMLSLLDEANYFEDILQIKEQQLRLKTLNIIDPYECNRDWQKFVYHPDIIKIVVGLFTTDISTACIIWQRHSASIMPYLNGNSLRKILNLIPTTIEAFSIVQWLRCFIPSAVQTFPSSMPYIVNWCNNKTRSLQLSNHWPAIGLEFVTKVLKIFENVKFLHSDIRRQYDACMENLRNLTNALEDLLVLKKSYNLILTLDNYEKDSMDQTTLRILERVKTSMLANLVKDFLYPIYREKGKTPIDAIIKHIRFLVASRNGFTLWIQRAVILIKLLHNEEEKLKSALLVLRSAPVPWPDALKPLIEYRNSSHTLATEINTVCEMQIVETMKIKYDWVSNTTDSNEKLLYRIVHMDLPGMMDDIKILNKANPSLEVRANFYCCYELSRNGKLKRAMDFLNFLDNSQRQICSQEIINIVSEILMDKSVSEEVNEEEQKRIKKNLRRYKEPEEFINENKRLFELMKSVSYLVNEEEQKRIKNIENLLLLKNNFGIQVHLEELFNENHKKQILQKGIEKIMAKINSEIEKDSNLKINIIKLIWKNNNELTNALMLDELYGLILIAKAMENLNLSCALAIEAIEIIECKPKNVNFFIEFAILIIFQQLSANIAANTEIVDPLAYPITVELFKKSFLHTNIFEIEILLKWVRIGANLYGLDAVNNFYSNDNNINDILIQHFKSRTNESGTKNFKTSKKRESLSIFDIPCDQKFSFNNNTSSDPTPVLHCLSLALLLVLIKDEEKDAIFKRFDEYLTDDIKNSSENLIEKFYISFEHLTKAKQHEYWYKIGQYLFECQKKFKTKILPSSFLSSQIRKMFRDLLSQKNPNFADLFAMLVSDFDPKLFLTALFTELKSEQQKINFFILSERYFALINDTEKVVYQRQCRLKYFYFSELRHRSTEHLENFDIEMMPLDKLKNELLKKILSIDLLEKFCDDFDLNYQNVLISQVINLLEKQELTFEIKLDQFGKEELIVKTCAEEIQTACQPYINAIENVKNLAEYLINFIPKINSYFYELYLCVFEIFLNSNVLSAQDTKKFKLFCSMLIFLKHRMITKRKARPTDIETESWLKNKTDKTTLSKIAKYRLPFSFFFEGIALDTIIKNDIDIYNCESWFPLIRFYAELTEKNCDKQDSIIMSTIKRAILKYSKDSDTWQLTPINNAFLQSILRLLNHLSDKSMTLAILYSLTNNAPDGADQVEAAYECYKYAIENESELLKANKPNSNEELIGKIKRKYPMFKIQHLLHIYNLVEDKLLQLIENPKELIIALYHHNSILKVRKPDINQLAKEIAALRKINLLKLQYALLEKWLSYSNESDVHELEETFYEDLNTNDTVINSDEFITAFVTRSHYILSSWEPNNAITFLVSNVFSSDGIINTGKQLYAFECFCKLMDGTNIDEEYLKVMDQQQFIIIKCVYYLKQLGFNFTIDKFDKYDKLSLLKKIWQNFSDKKLSMEIIANICVAYNIHEPKIWNGVLKQMVNFNMLNELNALIEILSFKKELLHITGLKMAWEYVLKLPFKNRHSCQNENSFSDNLFRIQNCPLVDEINLIEMAEDCIISERPHLAAILIGLCNEKQKGTIKKLVKNHISKNLKDDIIELEECGILQTIINNVLKELEL